MSPEDFKSAAALLDLLRKKGARTFEGFGIKLELAPLEAPQPVGGPPVNDELCACGHLIYEHQAGLCIAGGCDPTSCAKKET